MKHLLCISLIALIIAFNLTSVHAQQHLDHYRYKPHNYINNIKLVGGLGASSYYGDLCDKLECMRFRYHVSAGGMFRITPKFSIRAESIYMRLYSTDEGGDNAKRNLHFRANNFEFSAVVIYDFKEWNNIYGKREKFVPYVFTGVGAYLYSPRAKYQGKSYDLRKLQTEGVKYSSLTTAIPFGGGVRMRVTPFIDIGFEIGYRKTFSDYVDDVSGFYINNTTFNDPLAAALADRSNEGGFSPYGLSSDGVHSPEGARRGNPNRKDGYFLFGIKVDYTIKITHQFYNIHTHAPRYHTQHRHHHHKR